LFIARSPFLSGDGQSSIPVPFFLSPAPSPEPGSLTNFFVYADTASYFTGVSVKSFIVTPRLPSWTEKRSTFFPLTRESMTG
jgi:hypothetical protein